MFYFSSVADKPLPKARTKRFLHTLRSGQLKDHANAGKEVSKVLEWLWDAVIGPIIDEFGFSEVIRSTTVHGQEVLVGWKWASEYFTNRYKLIDA